MDAPPVLLSIPSLVNRYPTVKRREKVADCFGTQIIDGYQWMERDSEDLEKFVNAQNTFTNDFLENHPNRAEMRRILEKSYSYIDVSCPIKAGNGTKYIVSKKSELQNQAVLYLQEGIAGECDVLLDPNKLSKHGTTSVSTIEVSPNGEIMAYLIQESGSDWCIAKFLNIVTKESLPDSLINIKFTNLAWTKDNLGIIYSCYPDTSATIKSCHGVNLWQDVFYHKLGTEQIDDILLVSFPDNPDMFTPAHVSYCGNYAIFTPQKDCSTNLIYFLNLETWVAEGRKSGPPLVPIVENWEGEYKYVTSDGPSLYFRTNKDASNYSLIAIDLNAPEPSQWKHVLKHDKKRVLEWCTVVNDVIIASYLAKIMSTLHLYDLTDGTPLQTIKPHFGDIPQFSTCRDDDQFFFKFTNFETPGNIYRVDLNPRKTSHDDDATTVNVGNFTKDKPSSCFRCGRCGKVESKEDDGYFQISVHHEARFKNYSQPKLVVHQVYFPSKDGVKVPMFIAYCTRIKPRCRPCIMEVYGAHGFIFKPFFSPMNAAFMDRLDGIVVIVNARGGGEFGASWHEDGRGFKKQHTFDDVQCAAKHLIRERYTTMSQLVLRGTADGALCAAVCVNQRPDLFAAAIPIAGPMDMLKFDRFTIGYSWITEYGSPHIKKEAKNLLKYSPYHQIEFPKGDGMEFPAVLVVTGKQDDRVVAAHSYKYLAELQFTVGRNEGQTRPILLRAEDKCGLGAQKPVSKQIEEDLDILTFISYAVLQPLN